jgi:uncharacterized protein (TIGR02996 family)
MTHSDRLARALTSPAREPSGLLAQLLDAWREGRSAVLADAIDRVSAIAAEGRKPIDSDAEWLKVAAAGEAADVPRLFFAMANGVCKHLRGRMARLDERGPDPRLPALLLDLSYDHLYRLCDADGVWTQRTLIDTGDVRIAPLLRARNESGSLSYWMRERVALLDNLEAMPQRELTVLESQQLAALVARRAGRSVVVDPLRDEKMLQAIWAAPDDDAPREIYADWLQEQGDPRGEFIALQMARSRSRIDQPGARRERALLTRHKHRWLGPLAPWIAPVSRARFERGFVCAATFDLQSRLGVETFYLHPALSTLRQFRLVWGRCRDDANNLAARLERQGAVRLALQGNATNFTIGIE